METAAVKLYFLLKHNYSLVILHVYNYNEAFKMKQPPSAVAVLYDPMQVKERPC